MECEEEYVPGNDFECLTCPESWMAVGFLLLAVLALLGVLLYRLKKTQEKKEMPKMYSVFFKICLTTFQMNGLALSYSFAWSAMADSLFGVQEEVSTLGLAYLELRCLNPGIRNSFVLETFMYASAPAILAFLAMTVAMVHHWWPVRAMV